MEKHKRFNNKRVFVTGAAIGIGYEICRQFAMEGAFVGLNSIDKESCTKAVLNLNNAMGKQVIKSYPGDIANTQELQNSIDDFSEDGGIDVLVANAGITVFKPFMEVEPDEFDTLMQVNLKGTYFSVQAAARQMIRRKTGGRIILMSSVCGFRAHRHLSAYAMSKAGIRQLGKSLSEELGDHNITVNVIAPGATLTERTLEDTEYTDGWKSVAPGNTVGTPADVAHTTLFLAEDRSANITGEMIVVDGGWSVTSPLPSYLKEELG